MKPCQHCSLKPATRPRRLCPKCYAVPEVRALYQPLCTPGPQSEAEMARAITDGLATMPGGKGMNERRA